MSRLSIADRVLDGSWKPGHPAFARLVWRLHDITGWYERPPQRAESEPIPDGDGNYWPSQFLTGPRRFTVVGSHRSSTSSLARAEAEDWIASLDGEIPVVMDDEHGVRAVTAMIIGQPDYVRMDAQAARFTLPLEAPDPVKYGAVVPFSGGVVENAGGAAVLPWRIVTTGPATSILVVLDGHRIRWTGAASNVVIDTRAGTAIADSGDVTVGLVEDDVPLLAPGQTPMTITTDAASAVVEVRSGWR